MFISNFTCYNVIMQFYELIMKLNSCHETIFTMNAYNYIFVIYVMSHVFDFTIIFSFFIIY